MVSGFFGRRRKANVALFLQVTRIRKIRKISEANLTSRLLPETKRIEIYQSRITNHDFMTF